MNAEDRIRRQLGGMNGMLTEVATEDLITLLHELTRVRAALRDALQAPRAKVRTDAPETSRRAAKMTLGRSGSQRSRLLAEFYRLGEEGATDLELHNQTGIKENSVHPRRGELKEMGFIYESSEVREHSTVWKITEAGRQAHSARMMLNKTTKES